MFVHKSILLRLVLLALSYFLCGFYTINPQSIGNDRVDQGFELSKAQLISKKFSMPRPKKLRPETVESCLARWKKLRGAESAYKNLWKRVFKNKVSKRLTLMYMDCYRSTYVLSKNEFIYLLPNMQYLENLSLTLSFLDTYDIDRLKESETKQVSLRTLWRSAGGNIGFFWLYFKGTVLKVKSTSKGFFVLKFEGEISLEDTYDFDEAPHRGAVDASLSSFVSKFLPGTEVTIRSEPIRFQTVESFTYINDEFGKSVDGLESELCFEGDDYKGPEDGYSPAAVLATLPIALPKVLKTIPKSLSSLPLVVPVMRKHLESTGFDPDLFGEIKKSDLGLVKLLVPKSENFDDIMTLHHDLNKYCAGKVKKQCCNVKGGIKLTYRGASYCKCQNGIHLQELGPYVCPR